MSTNVDSPVDVTVVIPAFRAAGFVDRAIDSALRQEGVSLEVVVVDDGCPLHTADAVEARYADRSEVRAIRLRTNSGPSAARNAGVEAARGTWVAVLDADDAYEPGRLERLVRCGRTFEADMVADNVRLADLVRGTVTEPRLRTILEPTRVDLYRLLDGARPGTGELDYGLLKPIFRRDYLLRTGLRYPEHVRHGEDFLLYTELLRRGAAFYVIPDSGYVWSIRNSGLSQTKVDYLGQVRDVRVLQEADWVSRDPRAHELLDQRATALVQLHQTWTYQEALRRRRYGRAVLACLKHPHVRVRAIRSVRTKLRLPATVKSEAVA
jgi:succinoglycan biosynthesis protein ExoO